MKHFSKNSRLEFLRPVRLLILGATLCLSSMAHAKAGCDAELPGKIKGHITLPESCVYQVQLKITDGNTTLDCKNSTFDGGGVRKLGLLIDSEGNRLADVTVKNCTFKNFTSNGIRVAWTAKDNDKGADHKVIYERTPTRINFENVKVVNAGRVGIYLDDYTSYITIKNSEITGSGGVGIYLEHSSKNISLTSNRIAENGFGVGANNPREGLAIDSSADNSIVGNVFQHNAAGAIFLYKNCGEHFNTGKQVLRWQHSNNNVIEDNSFLDEKIGVWLASRQGRDLARWDCGDPSINKKGNYADFADFNEVKNNTFCRTLNSIRDNGKENKISGQKTACP